MYQHKLSTHLIPQLGPQAPLPYSWSSLKFASELHVHTPTRTQSGEGEEPWALFSRGWQQADYL